MKILVTGATGYLGHQIALFLANSGHIVHVLVRDPLSAYVPQHPNITVFTGNIRNQKEVFEAMKDCQQVYHAAAEVKVRTKTLFDSNVNGTKNILDSALLYGIKRVVFTSTGATLGEYHGTPVTENDPSIGHFKNDYELSKSIAEKMVIDYSSKGLETVIVYISKLYGPGYDRRSPGLMSMIKSALNGKIMFLPGPRPVLSNFVYMEDAVRGHILAMEKGLKGERYIIGGHNLTGNDFFLKVADANNNHLHFISIPLFLSKIIAGVVQAFAFLSGKDPLITPVAVSQLYRPKAYSSEKAIRELGYFITPLEDALLKTMDFLKTNSGDELVRSIKARPILH
jgi:nucleoside-diphosphate-sugar epimerase